MKHLKTLLLAIILITAAACTTPDEAEETAESPGTDNLANSSWTLQTLGPSGASTPVIGETPLTLNFESEGLVSGNGGCNSFAGSYEVQGSQLVFTDIVSTLVACADESLTAQEQQYVGALQTAGEFELTGDQLTINYDNNQGVLNFTSSP